MYPRGGTGTAQIPCNQVGDHDRRGGGTIGCGAEGLCWGVLGLWVMEGAGMGVTLRVLWLWVMGCMGVTLRVYTTATTEAWYYHR